MPYGKVAYDPNKDEFTCEFPIKDNDGNYTICNGVFQDLARHISRHHGITVAEYKKMLGLNKNTKLLSERTRKRLRDNINLKTISRRNLQPARFHFKKGDNTIQSYDRSPQNRSRLRKLYLYRKNVKLKTNP